MSMMFVSLLPFLVSGVDLAPPPVTARPAPAAMSAAAPVASPVPVVAAKPAPRPASPASPSPTPTPVRYEAPQTPPPAATPSSPPAQTAAPKPATPAPATAANDRTVIMDRISRALTETRTVKGRFTQVDVAGKASSGDFYISRPGKIRLDYKDPEPVYVVSDGVSVSIEEPKRDAYDAVPLSSTPLNLFLRSDVDLARSGDVSRVSRSGESWFVTMQDKTGEAEGQMILEFRGPALDLVGWQAIDGGGGVTEVALDRIETNVRLSPSLFVVRDPEDRDGDRR
ncbi:hypothetical protein GC169_10315 [bacterium]|nr:hypothetical protein [bacterium]